MVYVIVKNPRPRQGIEKPCIIACRSNIFPVVVDAKSSDPYEFESFAQDWLPGTDKLLVAARQYRQEDSPLSGLFLWDVVTDQVAPVMPGGVWGLYSPDGKILTWANYGQSAQYPSLVPGAPALDPIDLSHQTYLQLRDLASGKTLLSLPVQAWTRENGGDPDTFMDPYFTFSPDGRYITLVTPGRVTVDDLNWYAGDLNAGTSYFNVIDPQNRRLLKSIPVYGKVPYFGYRPIWSPDGSRFVYSDEKSNWQLFDVASASITPLTQLHGDLLDSPSWSFDGRYLQWPTNSSFDVPVKQPRRTFLLDLSALP